ncbi:MAG TPA: energy transducer TonB [Rudaea sp.]|nr:energy transducer TonB [Rudaea sp.]
MADSNSKTPSSSPSNPLIKIIPIIVILVGIAIAAYFFLHRGSAPGTPTVVPASGNPAPGNPAAVNPASPPAPAVAAPAAPTPELTVDEWLKKASAAFSEKRYVAPAGDNAVESYVQVLAKDPKNAMAQDALREIFPFATGAVEQEINAGNLDEATREINLLSQADPSNYTLTILRGKLDAKKKQAESLQKQQDLAAAAAAAAAAKAKAEAAAPPPEQTPVAAPAPAPAPPPKRAPAPVVAPPPQPVGETRPAELIKAASPEFPAAAYRRKQSGWVEVLFTVDLDGKVIDAKVNASEPRRVFDSAALDAVRKWVFKPRLENGKPVQERVTRRIEFKRAE